MTLFVSTPTYRTPPKLLRRSVASVLASDVEDVRVIVVNDGGPELRELPKDSRLLVFKLPVNRGRYFADAVVTTALENRPDDYYVPLDSDDWVEPEHYRRLLECDETGFVMSPYFRHRHNGSPFLQEPSRARLRNPDGNFVHLGHWCSGMYRISRVTSAGGMHPGFRVGFDTLFTLMLAMTGPVTICESPGYHWQRRKSDSLTTARETRFGSSHRAEAKKKLVALHAQAWSERARDSGAVIRRDVDQKLAGEVREHSQRLRELL